MRAETQILKIYNHLPAEVRVFRYKPFQQWLKNFLKESVFYSVKDYLDCNFLCIFVSFVFYLNFHFCRTPVLLISGAINMIITMVTVNSTLLNKKQIN